MSPPEKNQYKKVFDRISELNPFLSTSNAVYETLLNLIISGTLQGGEVIRQGDLAEQLGLSRTPVRDALSRLTEAGYLEKSEQSSVRVYSLDSRDYAELLEFRLQLEALAVRLTAINLTDETVDALKRSIADLKEASEADNRQAALNADERFHLAIIDGSNNQYVIATYHHYLRKIRFYRNLLSVKQNWKSTCRYHEKILAAITERDLEEGEKLIRQHLMISKQIADTL